MYSKLVVGLALAGAASAADIVRRDTGGGGGHSHAHSHDHGSAAAAPVASVSSGYSEPSSGYSAPSSGYSQPSAGYGAPAAGYGAPSAGYGAPSAGYGAPSSSYGSEAASYGGGYDVSGYEEQGGGGFDIAPAIIIPILIVLGLSLLFPTITNVSVNGRKKRGVEYESSPMNDIVERVNDIYMAVVESEECMERVACEIGGLAQDVGLQENSLTKMAETFVPAKYKGYYNQFQSGKNCHKIKCGSIF